MRLSDFPLYSMNLELMNQKAKFESQDKELVTDGIYVCVVYSTSGDDSEGYGTCHHMTAPIMNSNEVLKAIYFRGNQITEDQFKFVDRVNFEYREISNPIEPFKPLTWDDLIDCYESEWDFDFAREVAVDEFNESHTERCQIKDAHRYEH